MAVSQSRLYNFVNDKNAGTPITASKVDAELNAQIAALNRKVIAASTAPSSPIDGDSWIDLSQDPPVLKIYDQTNAGWTSESIRSDFGEYTAKTAPILADSVIINDSADSDAIKEVTLSNMLKLVYPVGVVVTFGVSTSPNTLFGFGTWTAIEGTVIVGLKSTGTFDTLDETGGAQSVAHTHTIADNTESTNVGWDGNGCGSKNYTAEDHTHGEGLTGEDTISVLQPYIVKYVWQRTA